MKTNKLTSPITHTTITTTLPVEISTPLLRAIAIMDYLDSIKPFYEELDQNLLALAANGFTAATISKDGILRNFSLKDNLKGGTTNTMYRVCFTKRFELTETKKPKQGA